MGTSVHVPCYAVGFTCYPATRVDALTCAEKECDVRVRSANEDGGAGEPPRLMGENRRTSTGFAEYETFGLTVESISDEIIVSLGKTGSTENDEPAENITSAERGGVTGTSKSMQMVEPMEHGRSVRKGSLGNAMRRSNVATTCGMVADAVERRMRLQRQVELAKDSVENAEKRETEWTKEESARNGTMTATAMRFTTATYTERKKGPGQRRSYPGEKTITSAANDAWNGKAKWAERKTTPATCPKIRIYQKSGVRAASPRIRIPRNPEMMAVSAKQRISQKSGVQATSAKKRKSPKSEVHATSAKKQKSQRPGLLAASCRKSRSTKLQSMPATVRKHHKPVIFDESWAPQPAVEMILTNMIMIRTTSREAGRLRSAAKSYFTLLATETREDPDVLISNIEAAVETRGSAVHLTNDQRVVEQQFVVRAYPPAERNERFRCAHANLQG